MGDSWKIRTNLTLNFGLRYVHDTGRTDYATLRPYHVRNWIRALPHRWWPAGTPCNGNILDLFGTGLGNRVRVPGHNFSPTAGFAWDPTGNGKTVIRAGAGLYYENSIFNNNLFNRPGHLAQGLFLWNSPFPWSADSLPCPAGRRYRRILIPPFFVASRSDWSIRSSAQLQALYQAATMAARTRQQWCFYRQHAGCRG